MGPTSLSGFKIMLNKKLKASHLPKPNVIVISVPNYDSFCLWLFNFFKNQDKRKNHIRREIRKEFDLLAKKIKTLHQ